HGQVDRGQHLLTDGLDEILRRRLAAARRLEAAVAEEGADGFANCIVRLQRRGGRAAKQRKKFRGGRHFAQRTREGCGEGTQIKQGVRVNSQHACLALVGLASSRTAQPVPVRAGLLCTSAGCYDRIILRVELPTRCPPRAERPVWPNKTSCHGRPVWE